MDLTDASGVNGSLDSSCRVRSLAFTRLNEQKKPQEKSTFVYFVEDIKLNACCMERGYQSTSTYFVTHGNIHGKGLFFYFLTCLSLLIKMCLRLIPGLMVQD